MTERYNGWANYETWRVNKEMLDGMSAEDFGLWFYGDDIDSSSRELASGLESYVVELVEMDSKGFALDLNKVDWQEIAEHMVRAGLPEDEAEDEDQQGWVAAALPPIINSVAYSPDGQSILIASDDHTLRVHAVADGTCRLRIDGTNGEFMGARYSFDGTFILSASWMFAIEAWDSDSGTLLWECVEEAVPPTALVVFDKEHFISGDAGGNIWYHRVDAEEYHEGFSLEESDHIGGSVNALAANGAGVRASASSKGIVRIWCDEETPDYTHEIELLGDEGLSLAMTYDGKTLAIGTAKGAIFLCNVVTGERTISLAGSRGPVRSVAFHPSGSVLASASDGQALHLWSVPSGELVRTIGGAGECVTSISFSPDGQQLAAGSEGRLRLWNVDTATEAWSVETADKLIEYFRTGRTS